MAPRARHTIKRKRTLDTPGRTTSGKSARAEWCRTPPVQGATWRLAHQARGRLRARPSPPGRPLGPSSAN
eukprot:5713251-Pyramimonas_sp.AAC.1